MSLLMHCYGISSGPDFDADRDPRATAPARLSTSGRPSVHLSDPPIESSGRGSPPLVAWREVLVFVQPRRSLPGDERSSGTLRKLSRSGEPGRPTVPREVRDLIPADVVGHPVWGAPGSSASWGRSASKSPSRPSRVHGPSPKAASPTGAPSSRTTSRRSWPSTSSSCPPCESRPLRLPPPRSRSAKDSALHVTANPTAAWTAQQMVGRSPAGSTEVSPARSGHSPGVPRPRRCLHERHLCRILSETSTTITGGGFISRWIWTAWSPVKSTR